jgi:hypothetical protein
MVAHSHHHSSGFSGVSIEREIVLLVVFLSVGLFCVLGAWYWSWETQTSADSQWSYHDSGGAHE